MKGIIFNITENFINDNYGEDIYDEIIESCNLITTEPIIAPGIYPFKDLDEIFIQSSKKLKLSKEELMKKIGHYTFSKLAEKYPNFVTPFNHPKEFLKTVECIIHVEVRKLYPKSELPSFQYSEPSEYELIITYYSERKLYQFMEGLINGVSEYFGIPIKQTQKIYIREGIEFCDFHLIFGK